MNRLLRLLIYGGSRRLRPYEQQAFDAIARVLPPHEASILRMQVQQVELIQRGPQDRIVSFHFGDSRVPEELLQGTEAPRVVGSASLISELGSSRVQLIAYKGRLSSLEFSRSPTRLIKTPFSIRNAVPGGPYMRIAESIDAEEHSEEPADGDA